MRGVSGDSGSGVDNFCMRVIKMNSSRIYIKTLVELGNLLVRNVFEGQRRKLIHEVFFFRA